MAGCATPRPEPTLPTPPDPDARPELAEMPAAERAALLRMEAAARLEPAAVRAAVDATLEVDPAEREALGEADRLWRELDPRDRASLADRVRGARLAAALGEWDLARERLGADDPDDPTRTAEVYRQGLELHARLLEQERQWYQALRARLSLDNLLIMVPDAQTANQRRIWALLSALRPAQRDQLARSERGEEAAWAELFGRLRAADDQRAARQVAADWERRHPAHPAGLLLPHLLASHPLRAEMPDDVMVLLPLSGNLANLGNALLDGITRAYYAETGGRGRLIIRDTRGDPEVAAGLYRQAVAGRVDHVIGPLHRDAVAAVAASEETRPTLLLNRAPQMGTGGELATLALNPEEDARAVADRAARAGWHHPLAILPEGEFGDRVATAWREALADHGLQPRGIERVHPGAAELNARVASALGIDQSQARIRRIASETRLELEGDPQVRGDIDHLFVAGTGRQVRQLIPHLHFHGGGRLPMMATAHVYGGHPDPGRDRDLTGIVFPDAPFLFDSIESLGDDQGERVELPRFVALGMDAMRLTLHDRGVREAPHHQLHGGAGTWSLNPISGEWIREPAWARFEGGEAHRIDAGGAR